jgi:hypothetical protein
MPGSSSAAAAGGSGKHADSNQQQLALTSGRYHTPLQRALLALRPDYTEAELATRSRFAPTFYAGPRCESLVDAEDDDERYSESDAAAAVADGFDEDPKQTRALGMLPPGPRAKALAERAEARRQAAVRRGDAPHYPGALPLDTLPGSSSPPSSAGGPNPWRPAERQLLQSSFDAVDAAYPSPRGKSAAPGPSLRGGRWREGVATTLARFEPDAALNAELAAQQAETVPGTHKQIVTRMPIGASAAAAAPPAATVGTAGAAGSFDVFTLPKGFRVVRDGEGLLFGGGHLAASAAPAAAADAVKDPALKARIKGVLDGLASKYEDQQSTAAASMAGRRSRRGSMKEEKEAAAGSLSVRHDKPHPPPRTVPPSGSFSARAAAARSSSVASIVPVSSDLPQQSGTASRKSHARNSTVLTPGPTIERAVGLPPSSTTPSAAGSAAVKRGVAGQMKRGSVSSIHDQTDKDDGAVLSIADQNEVEVMNFEQLAADRAARRSRKKGSKQPDVVGAALSISARKAAALRLPSSRGVQLLSRIMASVRLCAVVPLTQSVWTTQRDPVLVIRHRLTGRVVGQLDTGALVGSMLLLPECNQMWLGMESGEIMAYDVRTLKRIKQATDHAGAVHALVRGVAPYHNATTAGPHATTAPVFSASTDFTMVRWNASSMTPEQHYTGHAGGVRSILPLSAARVWSGGDDGAIRVYDVASAECVAELVRHTGSVLSLICTGTHVWSAGEDGSMCLWSLGGSSSSTSAAADGTIVTTTCAGSDGPQCLRQISTGNERIQTVSLVGNQVWSCGQDPRIHIWSIGGESSRGGAVQPPMEWLGSLGGHTRYLSSFVQVRLMETRYIWSFGLGEAAALVWRSEQITDVDSSAELRSMQGQLASQAAEMDELRRRAERAEQALRDSDARRAEEEQAFRRQIDELVLALAQAALQKAALEAALKESEARAAELAAQNASLRNELRLHLEKLALAEKLLRDALESVATKDEHVQRLMDDMLAQADRFQKRQAELEQSLKDMAAKLAGGDGAMQELADQLAASRARIAELERAAQAAADAAFYQAETARLRSELESERSKREAADRTAKAREQALQGRVNELEQALMNALLGQKLAQRENGELKAQLTALQAAYDRQAAERAAEQAKARAEAQAARERDQAAEAAAARVAQEARSAARRIRALEALRDRLQAQLDSLRALLGFVARELKHVETSVTTLARPDSEIYTAPRPHPHANLSLHSVCCPAHPLRCPPPEYFSSLSGVRDAVAVLMARCLERDLKAHVGFAHVGAAAKEVPRGTASAPVVEVTNPSSSAERSNGSDGSLSVSLEEFGQLPLSPRVHRARPLPLQVERATTAPVVAGSSDDDGAADSELHVSFTTDPAHSPVTAIWTADSPPAGLVSAASPAAASVVSPPIVPAAADA